MNSTGVLRRSLFVIVGAALCTAGCESDPPAPEGGGMRLEVDLYSGRSNPVADLGADVADEFLRRVAALAPAAAPVSSPSARLGYRGLRVTFASASDPAGVFVSDGTVTVRDAAGDERWLADPGRGLERWLIGAAASDLDAAEVAAVQAELER